MPHEYCVRIAALAITLLAAGALQLATAEVASVATLDRVRQTGKLTLGYRADARPFSYQDEAGTSTVMQLRYAKNSSSK